MQLTPLLNQAQGTRWNAAGDDLAGLDRDHDGLAGIRRVEVRHAVLAVVHRDDDPVELADPRHAPIVAFRADIRRASERTRTADPFITSYSGLRLAGVG